MKLSLGAILRILLAVAIFLVGLLISYMFELNKTLRETALVVKNEKEMLAAKAGEATKAKKALEAQLEALAGEKKLLLDKVNEYELASKETEKKVGEFEDRMAKLREDTAAKEQKMEAIRREKDQAIAELKGKIEEYQAAVDDLNAKVEAAYRSARSEKKAVQKPGKAPIEIDPVVVESKRLDKNIKAKVVEVNRQYDFVVINAGAGDGVSDGDSLYISRGGEVIGRVIVEKTSKTAAVAKILYKSLNDLVKPGDNVKY